MTHAFFKALLFLAAGSVIICMHHEQDMRKMGGLRKYMPITYWTLLIGTLALVGTPFFSGYYSKDLIIDAVKHQHHLHPDNAIATYAYWCVMIGVFVTAFYSFRLLFMTFHGKPRWDAHASHDAHAHDAHAHDEKHETHAEAGQGAHGDHAHDAHASHDDQGHGHHGGPPLKERWDMTGPLIALAIPSVFIGAMTFKWLLFDGGFGQSIYFNSEHQEAIHEIGESMGNWWKFGAHFLASPVFWIMASGAFAAWVLYIWKPHLPGVIDAKLKPLRWILERKYGFDWFNENVLAAGGRLLGKVFWKAGDGAIIDGVVVDGTAKSIGLFASVVRRVQSGFLYSYAFWMVIGLAVMLGWFLTH
jgi:NADH-quinone oxidoreductase subunit L